MSSSWSVSFLIPAVSVWIIFVISQRHPTGTTRWTSQRVSALLGRIGVTTLGLAILTIGLLTFGASIIATTDPGEQCAQGVGLSVPQACSAHCAEPCWRASPRSHHAGRLGSAGQFLRPRPLDHLRHGDDASQGPAGTGRDAAAGLHHARRLHVPDDGVGLPRPHPQFPGPDPPAKPDVRSARFGSFWRRTSWWGFFHNEAGPFDSPPGAPCFPR